MDTNQTQKTNGALVGSIIIVVILIIGGIYLVRQKMQNDRIAAENAQILQEQQQANADKLSNSDDMSDIETDLNANSDMNGLDKDLN